MQTGACLEVHTTLYQSRRWTRSVKLKKEIEQSDKMQLDEDNYEMLRFQILLYTWHRPGIIGRRTELDQDSSRKELYTTETDGQNPY